MFRCVKEFNSTPETRKGLETGEWHREITNKKEKTRVKTSSLSGRSLCLSVENNVEHKRVLNLPALETQHGPKRGTYLGPNCRGEELFK